MNLVQALVANPQSPIAIEPSGGAFGYPPVASQALARFNAASGNPGLDVACSQHLSTEREIISLVGMQLGRATPRTTAAPPDGPNRVNRLFQYLGIMHIGCGLSDAQRDALPVDHKMALRARFAAIRWIRPGFFPPRGAGTLDESSAARDQSIWSAWPNWSSKSWCRRFQAPAFCQWRKARQQVIPLPQPISRGSISQGMPLWSTNRMPVSLARSGMDGRPPFGLGRSGGKSGSISCHRSSLTRGLDMPLSYSSSRFC